MDTVSKPLRILLVLNVQADARLGAVRACMGVADEWRSLGHTVEQFTLSDAFPGARGSRAGFALLQMRFAYKAAAFIRKNAARFDIVDAIIGSLPSSKEQMGYKRLLVARSTGLYHLYDRFEKSVPQRWPRRSRGKFLGRIFYTLFRRWLLRASDKAVCHADLINVHNQDEVRYLEQELGCKRPIIVEPCGLTREQRQRLHEAAVPPEVRLARKKVCFVGMWVPRKGSRDWGRIIRCIWKNVPEASFRFLGTMVDSSAVMADLELEPSEQIELVSKYSPEDLPALLADCTVAAFPSYVEGFGIAVLEQLAAGIPTVAFDIAGPRDILGTEFSQMLVPSGNLEAFANAICRILNLDLTEYRSLSERSAAVVTKFSWSAIAQDTLAAYREALQAISK